MLRKHQFIPLDVRCYHALTRLPPQTLSPNGILGPVFFIISEQVG